MKTRIFAAITGLAALLLVAVALAPGVLAQAPTPTSPASPASPSTFQNGNGNGYGPGNGGMMGGTRNGTGTGTGMGAMMGGTDMSLIEISAEKLGMTRADLVAALGGTRSIAQVATEHNVAVDTIIDAFLAPRSERLDTMVTAGRFTREQAAEMLATMRTHVTEEINEVWSSQGAEPGSGFVDSDGDGVCDNMPANGNNNGNRMHGPGMGPNR